MASNSLQESPADTQAGAYVKITAALPELAGSVVAALRTVYDPEIPVNIFDLGLVYRIAIDESGNVDIDMTLTTVGCPVAHIMPGKVEEATRGVDGVNAVSVNLVWDPPWTQARMSDIARLELGMF